MNRLKSWQEYQEEAADFFRSIGLEAETDVRLQGARTTSDVDVLVTQEMAGFEVRWIVECKHWKTAVNQLHVFGLREIVQDLGADRGIILCEAGFQKGAGEAAALTNVQLASIAHLKAQAAQDVFRYRLTEIFDRCVRAKDQYWEIPKGTRIKFGLRGDYDPTVRNRGQILEGAIGILGRAMRGAFPITIDHVDAMYLGLPWISFLSPQALFEALEPEVEEAEVLIAQAIDAHPEFRLQ
ncbi:restriction endonuclease [Qipengyuania sp.]|uniref:restriction endonuclease n=1 Tax=Qipengyuania sp. TaxID=2004515 RepID=UPI003AF6684B